MRYHYVTIEREYGSGGTTIAREVGKQNGMKVYGIELLEMVAKNLQIPIEQIESNEEKVTNSFLYSIYIMSKNSAGEFQAVSDEDRVYIEEQNIIQNLSTQGPSIFVGRCAANALKDRDDVLRVFIRSGLEEKKKRIMEQYKIPKKSVEQTMKRFDKKRGNYYHANTKKKWDAPENYDLVLDSGSLGIDGCVRVIESLLGID